MVCRTGLWGVSALETWVVCLLPHSPRPIAKLPATALSFGRWACFKRSQKHEGFCWSAPNKGKDSDRDVSRSPTRRLGDLCFYPLGESTPTWRIHSSLGDEQRRHLEMPWDPVSMVMVVSWSTGLGDTHNRLKMHLSSFNTRSSRVTPLLSWTSLGYYLRNQLNYFFDCL